MSYLKCFSFLSFLTFFFFSSLLSRKRHSNGQWSSTYILVLCVLWRVLNFKLEMTSTICCIANPCIMAQKWITGLIIYGWIVQSITHWFRWNFKRNSKNYCELLNILHPSFASSVSNSLKISFHFQYFFYTF